MTAAPSARPRPSLVVTEVKHDARFDPAKHPRAHDGRFAHTPGEGWRLSVGNKYRSTGISNLRPGDTIYTGGDSAPELPKPVGLTSGVIPTSHRRERTVDRVEQGDSGTTVHFTDGTSISEKWANHPVYASRDAKPATPEAPDASDGVPKGWDIVSAGAEEQEWRADLRSMYDALKADGVDLPDFEAYYARVTQRTGKTFGADVQLTRQVGKTQVKIVVGDLPKEHWAQAASDVEAVVGGRNVKDELSVAFRSASFANQPKTLGQTTLGGNHLEINPTIYTRRFLITTDNLMPSAKGDPPRYVLAHEYGHAIGAGSKTARGVERAAANTHGASRYGRFDATEGAAEAYADWFITKGASTNEFTKAVARLEGWT